ncbi:hypothetical protein RS84_01904 [Microbacterium hydrocarbonoxydans]|uniref:Right handed beta helix region n=1 Tax=Microbacterium hydrocarbonoxydans TaxID=273678 RepID=A0A0M2HRK0_9MICO|nr:hypothetical protein [Microbacterium hydrocarbonoxydans]KJL47119.1 hypothetical protein RS84_01904 [Microbacterium hydrocarbonoxydans]
MGVGSPPATVVVASNDAPASIKSTADFVCDGTADEVEINAAIATASNDSVSLGGQGGSVLLWGKEFTVGAAIKMRSQVTLSGMGQWATTVRASSSFSGGENSGVFELYSTNTQYTTVSSLTIHGNAAAGARTCGVFYQQGAGQEWDAAHRLLDLYIYATGWHGMFLTSTGAGARNRAYYVQNVRIIDAGTTVTSTANGMKVLSVDSFFIGIDVGSSASHGVLISGANNRFVSCKSWYSGSMATTDHQGSGFYVTGAQRNQFSACEAQDNYGDGFYLGGGNNTLSACFADSNGYNRGGGGGAGVGWTGSGFYIAGYVTLQGIALDKNEGGRGLYQQYGVEVAYAGIKGIVDVVTDVNGVAALGGSTMATGSVVNVI